MEIHSRIPFKFDLEKLARQTRVEPDSDDARDLSELVDAAQQIGNPKAVYSEAYIEARDGDHVTIGGRTFASRALSRNLEGVGRVFPVIVTCGRELDDRFPARGDMLKEFWWDLIKTQVFLAATAWIHEHLHRKFRLGKTVTMHPGSGDADVWPIEQQVELFSLLGDVRGAIGVELTESFLMVPNKTTSGLMFQTEKDFKTCQLCHRGECPSRQAPFDAGLWAEMQHE